MKTRISAFIMCVTVLLSALFTLPAMAEAETLPEIGDELYGFKVIDKGEYKTANAETITFEHIKSGATLFYIKNDDENLAFNISYRTPNTDESDRNHVFEHAIINSSEKYPSTDIFFDVYNKTYNTYVNASTSLTTTNYMLASMSEEQLKIMIDVYLSCMVSPGILENENFFKREALNYTLEDKDSDIEIGGTVFSEDTGLLTDTSRTVLDSILDALYPNEIASNVVGKAVENYKELTYEHTIELYDMCYHFDNSIITLYGDLNYKEFLKFIDEEYLSKYERNNTDLSAYKDGKSEPKFVNEVVYSPAYEGDSTENASIVVYAVDLDGYSYDDLIKLAYSAKMLNSDSSLINQRLQEKGIYGSFGASMEIGGSKPFIAFSLYNTEPDVREDFMNIVTDSLNEISENGVGDLYNNILKSAEITDLLQDESTTFGIDSSIELSQYWAVTGKTDIFELENKAFEELKNDSSQTELKRLIKSLLNPENSALTAAVPKPGLAEEIDSEREAYLAEMKANMTEAEIEEMINETKEYNEWVNNSVSNNNVSIDPEQLPEPKEDNDVSIKTLGSVTSYSSEVEKSAGSYTVIFDVSNIAQEDLYDLYIYLLLIDELDTANYTSEELAEISPAYLNDFSAGLSYYKLRDQDDLSLMFMLDWYALSEDYEKSLDLMLEIIERTDFSGTGDIIYILNSYLPNLDPARTSNTLNFVLRQALGGISKSIKFNNYFRSKEFYEYVETTVNRLTTDETYGAKFEEKMNGIAEQIIHKNNIVAAVVGDSGVIEHAEAVNNEVLNSLPEIEFERAVYDFGETESKTAYIAELSNQTGVLISELGSDFKGEYIPYLYLINDVYTVPEIRFKNGAYSGGTKVSISSTADYMYTYSYSDPGVGSTMDVFENLAGGIADEDITQEELDDYIVAAYSSIVVPQGQYTKAENAITYALLGIDGNPKTKFAEGIKNSSAEDKAEAAEAIQKLVDNGYIAFVGNSTSINNDKDLFDSVIDLR
ncbi:MAG: insulinase family protein [Eubacterium sp.]|nr:insulinase family protein [Eubacterium sp.]